MSNELATVSQNQLSLTFYEQVKDPLEFIDRMGKALALSGVVGCKSESDGKIVAWACLAKKKDPFELAQRYHFMGGKLVIKAEQMLADFRTRLGGKSRWIKDGKDGQSAELELIGPDNQKVVAVFDMATAMKAGYVKKDSQWEKRPDQMLRSRCITDGIRMGWPEISGGNYSEDEIYDVESDGKPSASTSSTKPAKSSKATSVQAESTVATQALKPATETIVDAEVVSKTSTATNSPAEVIPFDVPGENNASQVQAAILEINLLIEKCGWTTDQVCTIYNKKWQTTAKQFEDFTDEQLQSILGKVREVLAKSEADKLAAVPNSTSA